MDFDNRALRRLKLADLRVFHAVVQWGGMAKAAVNLNISQPAVSRSIAALEHTLGVRLLDRNASGVEPTLYGRALLKGSVAVFDELSQCTKEIEFLADPSAGVLRIGCNETVAAGLLPAIIDRFSRQHPHVTFHIEIGTPATLQSRELRERNCDLVLTRLVPAAEPDMETETLFDEELVVVAAPRSKWATRRRIRLADLVDEPWILVPHEVMEDSPVAQAFRAQGLGLPQARLVGFSQHIRHGLLATGRFLTVVPSSVLRFGAGRVFFKALPVRLPDQPRPVVVITVKGRTLSPVAKLFIACAREVSKPLAQGR